MLHGIKTVEDIGIFICHYFLTKECGSPMLTCSGLLKKQITISTTYLTSFKDWIVVCFRALLIFIFIFVYYRNSTSSAMRLFCNTFSPLISIQISSKKTDLVLIHII